MTTKAKKKHSDAALKRAASEAGGVLITIPTFALASKSRYALPELYAPGCGAYTHVAGTNGGEMPCGAMLRHLDGKVEQYFCGHCRVKWALAEFYKEFSALAQKHGVTVHGRAILGSQEITLP